MRRPISLLDLRAPVTVVAAAAVAWLAPTPWLGVPSTIALVWLAGSSVVLLVAGNPMLDQLAYRVASGIAGLAVLVATALVMYVTGIRITATSVPIAVAVAGVALTVAAIGARSARREVATRGDPLDWLNWALTAALLVGGAAFALAVQKPASDTWALMSVNDSVVRSGSPLSAAPGGQVTVGWELVIHGYRPATDKADVTVEVGTSPVKAKNWMDTSRSKGQTTVNGQSTFSAPKQPGLYRVQVQITTADAKGRPVTRDVNVHLQVSKQ